MTETTAAQQQVQYVSKAQFDKLVAYVQELVADHNRLEVRVEDLERVLLGNGRKTSSAADTGLRGRDARSGGRLVSGDIIEVPDAQHEEIVHLIEVEIGGYGHIANVLCPCNPRLVPVHNLGSKPYFALASRHYEPVEPR